MAVQKPSTEFSSWISIAHSSLANTDIITLIRQKQIKVKNSITEGAMIFPKAKIAFLLIDLTNLVSRKNENKVLNKENNQMEYDTSVKLADAIARIDKFIGIHAHCYVILQASLFTAAELEIVTHFQINYLNHSVDFMLAHDPGECVSAVTTVASLHTPPTSEILSERFRHLIEEQMKPLDTIPTLGEEVQEKPGLRGGSYM